MVFKDLTWKVKMAFQNWFAINKMIIIMLSEVGNSIDVPTDIPSHSLFMPDGNFTKFIIVNLATKWLLGNPLCLC